MIPNLSIDHFYDDDIILELPEFISFLLSAFLSSFLNPAEFKKH